MKKYAYDLLLMIKLDNEDIWYIDDMGGCQIWFPKKSKGWIMEKFSIFGLVGIGVGEIFEYNFLRLEFFG